MTCPNQMIVAPEISEHIDVYRGCLPDNACWILELPVWMNLVSLGTAHDGVEQEENRNLSPSRTRRNTGYGEEKNHLQ